MGQCRRRDLQIVGSDEASPLHQVCPESRMEPSHREIEVEHWQQAQDLFDERGSARAAHGGVASVHAVEELRGGDRGKIRALLHRLAETPGVLLVAALDRHEHAGVDQERQGSFRRLG